MTTPIALPTLDSYWIREHRLPAGQLVAGEYPSAKDAAQAEIKLARFVQFGVTTFVDLTEEGEHGLRPYAGDIRALAAASGRSVTHHRRPIPDLGTPAPQTMRDILDTIDTALAAREMVYVHCYGGIGRTGTVIGCWLVRHGLSGEEALHRIAEWRAHTPDGWRASPETPDQRALILSWREVEGE